MQVKNKIVAVIPARGGSKGIPRKNIRLLKNKPLIAYVIYAALKSKYIDKVVVSTDDLEIAQISKFYGTQIIKRPAALAGDRIPLDPVIYHAVNSIESEEHVRYDFVITIQSTSPLLTTQTIDDAIEVMLTKNYDTLISVIEDPHLCWTKKGNQFTPLYSERKNRQFLDPIYKETGSLLISKRDIITENNRIGKKPFLFSISPEEGIDIDTYTDWMTAENILNKKKIVFRVDGDGSIGLGHIYRTITLANRIFGHDIIFLMDASKKLGIQKVVENNYRVMEFENSRELFDILKNVKPDIIINDILDTDKDYILKLKKLGLFVVNFEDLGEGADFADVVINALYENSDPPKNHYYGYKYECLRDEFYLYPKKKVPQQIKDVLVTFGGVDENNLTLRTLRAIEKIGLKDACFIVVLGLGYPFKKNLQNYVESMKEKGFNIVLKQNIKSMAECIYNSDLVITSNGRTIYEVVSIGTPCISISQNEREVTHLFSRVSKTVMNLGIAFNVSEDKIAVAIKKTIDDLKSTKNKNKDYFRQYLLEGTQRVLSLIFNKFEEWAKNGN